MTQDQREEARAGIILRRVMNALAVEDESAIIDSIAAMQSDADDTALVVARLMLRNAELERELAEVRTLMSVSLSPDGVGVRSRADGMWEVAG